MLSNWWVLAGGAVHVRLPWLQCQRQAPAEAAILKQARAAWAAAAVVAAAAPPPPAPSREPRPAAAPTGRASRGGASPTGPPAAAAAVEAAATGAGPLLLFPDTSALLAMLGATGFASAGTPLTLRLLEVCPPKPLNPGSAFPDPGACASNPYTPN